MPLSAIEVLKGFPHKGKVIAYCASGVRSAKAQKLLSACAIVDVVGLKGWIRSLERAGGRVLK